MRVLLEGGLRARGRLENILLNERLSSYGFADAGPEEPLQSFGSVASGGETARVMLALKAAPALMVSPAHRLPQTFSQDTSRLDSGESSAQGPERLGPQPSVTPVHPEGAAYPSRQRDMRELGTHQVLNLGASVMILDEVDSGIGSRLGTNMGKLLRRIASPPASVIHQIICVTHLAQVRLDLTFTVTTRLQIVGISHV